MVKKNNQVECNDPNCPFHGNLSTRGNTFTGLVVSNKMKRTVTVEWTRINYLPKYERYEKRKTRLKAHSPDCLNIQEGDYVKIMNCRPLSKTKNFVVIKKMGSDRTYEIEKEAKEEAKIAPIRKDKEQSSQQSVELEN